MHAAIHLQDLDCMPIMFFCIFHTDIQESRPTEEGRRAREDEAEVRTEHTGHQEMMFSLGGGEFALLFHTLTLSCSAVVY